MPYDYSAHNSPPSNLNTRKVQPALHNTEFLIQDLYTVLYTSPQLLQALLPALSIGALEMSVAMSVAGYELWSEVLNPHIHFQLIPEVGFTFCQHKPTVKAS